MPDYRNLRSFRKVSDLLIDNQRLARLVDMVRVWNVVYYVVSYGTPPCHRKGKGGGEVAKHFAMFDISGVSGVLIGLQLHVS